MIPRLVTIPISKSTQQNDKKETPKAILHQRRNRIKAIPNHRKRSCRPPPKWPLRDILTLNRPPQTRQDLLPHRRPPNPALSLHRPQPFLILLKRGFIRPPPVSEQTAPRNRFTEMRGVGSPGWMLGSALPPASPSSLLGVLNAKKISSMAGEDRLEALTYVSTTTNPIPITGKYLIGSYTTQPNQVFLETIFSDRL